MALQASIRLLRADAAGLTRYLEEQAVENPHLKLDPPPPPTEWLPRWRRVFQTAAGDAPEQSAVGASLMAHVMAEIDRRMRQPEERRVALALAEALEPSGWLGRPLVAVAKDLGIRVREVEAVLRRLQEIEPVGLFARDLAECLRLQAQEEGKFDRVMDVVLGNLDLLAKGDLPKLAALAKVEISVIQRCFATIRAMNPKPGTEFDAMAVQRPREPDLVVKSLEGGGWDVALNRSCLPTLRISTDQKADARALAAAKALERMVEARNSTLLRVGHEIMQRQQQALAQGAGALIPMTMADIAEAVGVHESTVSRIVAGTSIDTPHGLWWLRLMFSRAVGNDGIASAALRDRLQHLVAEEPPNAPMSDEELAQALSAEGASVARRTVTKYRAMLKIPPAHRRRKHKLV